MAKNDLTPEQDLAVREFYEKVVAPSPDPFVNCSVSHRQALSLCMNLLGYVLVNGNHVAVEKYKKSTNRFGQPSGTFEDEYDADKEAAYEATHGDTHRTEADSSEPSTSAPVRQTIFRKDV